MPAEVASQSTRNNVTNDASGTRRLEYARSLPPVDIAIYFERLLLASELSSYLSQRVRACAFLCVSTSNSKRFDEQSQFAMCACRQRLIASSRGSMPAISARRKRSAHSTTWRSELHAVRDVLLTLSSNEMFLISVACVCVCVCV